MAFKMIVGFVVALAAAVGADALICRPGSYSVALSSSTLTMSIAILETSSTATVSNSEESTASTTGESTASTTTSITSSSTEESRPASSTTFIIISTNAESTSASSIEATTTTTTTTTSITISKSEEPTSSTTTSEPTSCPTDGLVCGDDGYVQPRPGLKYTNLGVSSVEACTAACIETADCYFFLINRGSKACTLYKMSKQEAGLQKIPTAAYIAYERGCFVC